MNQTSSVKPSFVQAMWGEHPPPLPAPSPLTLDVLLLLSPL